MPPLDFLAAFPPAADFALLACAALSLLFVVARPTSQRAVLLATAGLAGLMLFDQLRWQPWAYQGVLVGVAIAGLPAPSREKWLRALLVSVYLYAAIAKADTVFVHTLGQQITGVLASLVGLDAAASPNSLRVAFAALMPVGEAAVGLLLAWPRSRKLGVAAAVLLHAMILLALSPLGLGHELGVLLWNVVQAALVAVLFWPSEETQHETSPSRRTTYLAKAVLLLAIAAPLSYPLGWWDRWPSWGLYAPRGERAEVWVHQRVVDRLPEGVPLAEPNLDDSWRQVLLGEWMLAETGAPRYPQNRIVVALALALDDQARLGSYLRVHLDSQAGRFDASRDRLTLEGADAIREHSQRAYWVSTSSRWTD